ncbi:Protein O-linked-mannose beta-1,4-N-acetylglucosaminyltransferase 2 [Blyttiomyces sp. JEL0837]|nr:Protein O-linked-mannose beta-1,4-N-acetylglucosaminyltransferase 2 [Blyttiomyces sp. JEL0837]
MVYLSSSSSHDPTVKITPVTLFGNNGGGNKDAVIDWKKKYEELVGSTDQNTGNQQQHLVTATRAPAPDKSAVPIAGPKVEDGGPEVSGKNRQMEDMMLQSSHSSNNQTKGAGGPDVFGSEPTVIFYRDVLPSSSVWCKGDQPAGRVCRFRNLCYHPKEDRFFIVKTNSTVIEGLPEHFDMVLESGTVNRHPWTRWTFDQVSPWSEAFQHIPVRYETEFTVLFKRFHPLNIMHNLHDDVIILYHHLKEYVGGGDESLSMPFSIFDHRIQFIDPYDYTESTRPFQYLAWKELRMKTYIDSDTNVITCWRDATVGTSKLTTWYQYGFEVPQGPIPNKTVNGLHVREVAEWLFRRLGIPLGDDEIVQTDIAKKPDVTEPVDYSSKALDFAGTDLIIILSRRKNRLILNEVELAKALQEKFGYEAMFVRNEDHTFEEQIALMRRARVVLAMHGSILIMTMFCRRGTVVVELYPYAVPSAHYTPYKTLAELPGMDMVYRAWENTHPENSIAHPDDHEMVGGIVHLPLEEQEKIKNTLTVPEHLCCVSPYWLYRIYQDTKVEITEVSNLIESALIESRKLLEALKYRNVHAAILLPPIVHIENIACLAGDSREPGTLWVGWTEPWNGVKVDYWVVRILNDDRYFSTEGPMVSISGYKPGEDVYFAIKGVVQGGEQEFGPSTFCTV